MQETIPYQPGMNLGRTYDLRKLQPGLDIFTDEALSRSKTIERHQTSIRYSVINKSSDINNILDVGGEISLKMKAGILKFEGMGSCLKDNSWKENTLEILARAHVETMTETMTDSNPKPDWKNNIVGSHYIRSITYGGDLIVRIQIQGSDKKQIEDIRAKLDAGLKTGGIIDAGAKANFRKLEEDLKASSNIHINYYSTSLQGAMPRDIDGMLNALDTFKDQVIKLNEGKGAPLICELQPLNILDPDLPQVMRDKTLDVELGILEESYDDILQAKAKFDRFAGNEDLKLAVDQEEKASELEKRLENVLSVFNSVIASIDVTIGGNGKLQIEKAVSAYKTNKKFGGFKKEVANFVRSVQPEATPLTPLRDLPLGEQLDLVLFGKTGHGKSATGNTILGDNRFPSKSSATSVTSQCRMEQGTVGGREICLVDTPGMLDTDHPDEMFQEVATAITFRPDGYHAFLFVLNIDARMTEEEQKAIVLLKEIFGANVLMEYGILVFTHGDSFYNQQRKNKTNISFEEHIKAQGGKLAELLEECNQRFVLLNNMEEDTEKLRDQVIELIGVTDNMIANNGGKKYKNKYFKIAKHELNKQYNKGKAGQALFDTVKQIIVAFLQAENGIRDILYRKTVKPVQAS